MKKLLCLEAASVGVLLLFIVLVIQVSSCERREKVRELETENHQVRVSRDLWIYAGEIGKDASPLETGTESEENFWGFFFSNIFLDAETQDHSDFIYQTQTQERNTCLTITINPPVRTSSGNEVTADDLLFNYYLRCDPSFMEGDSFASGIDGGKEYYYGTEQMKKRKKKIKESLKKPVPKLQEMIRSHIIIPELEREYRWVEELFKEKEYEDMRKGHQSVEEFFSYFYACQISYDPSEKTKEELVSEIAGQYGSDYHALEKVTGKSYQAKAEACVLSWLLGQKNMDEVKKIRGLRKLNEHTIQITLLGTSPKLQKYLDFWLLPLKEYGTARWKKKGEAFQVCEHAKETYLGSGSFSCTSLESDIIHLQKNQYKTRITKEPANIYLYRGSSFSIQEIVKRMLDGKLDMAVFLYSSEAETLIKEKKTGAIEKLAYFFTGEETDLGILYSADYINATTFPTKRSSIRQVIYEMGKLEVNE